MDDLFENISLTSNEIYDGDASMTEIYQLNQDDVAKFDGLDELKGHEQPFLELDVPDSALDMGYKNNTFDIKPLNEAALDDTMVKTTTAMIDSLVQKPLSCTPKHGIQAKIENIEDFWNFHGLEVDLSSQTSKKDAEEPKATAEVIKILTGRPQHIKRYRKFNYMRWGRKEDVILFEKLQTSLKAKKISLAIFSDHISNPSKVEARILEQVMFKAEWKGTLEALVLRIKNLLSNNKLSVREKRLLRQLTSKDAKAKKPINFQKLTTKFPGKTAEALKAAFDSNLTGI